MKKLFITLSFISLGFALSKVFTSQSEAPIDTYEVSSTQESSPEVSRFDQAVEVKSKITKKNNKSEFKVEDNREEKSISLDEAISCLKNRDCKNVESGEFYDESLSEEVSKVEKSLMDIVQSSDIKKRAQKHSEDFYLDALQVNSKRALLASSIILLEMEMDHARILESARNLKGDHASLFMSVMNKYDKTHEQYRDSRNSLLNDFIQSDPNTLLSVIESMKDMPLDSSEVVELLEPACPSTESSEIDGIIKIKINELSQNFGGAALCQ